MNHPDNEQKISVVDIGSNTVKFTHASVGHTGEITVLAEAAETIRLGADLDESGIIAPDRMDACIGVLQAQEAIGKRFGLIRFAGVATETLRVASNGSELLDRIRRETSWNVRVISGDEEAHLTWLGLRDQVSARGSVLIIDIGGGSTEIVRVEAGQVRTSVSIPLGSGRLADLFFQTDPPGPTALVEAAAAALEHIENEPTIPAAVDSVVFSGGNGLFIQQMLHQLFPGQEMGRATISSLLDHFAVTPAADTAERIGIAHERARVLPAGAAIALAFLQHIDAKEITAAPSGIRTGLIRELTEHDVH